MHSQRRGDGFTLIELAVTLFVFALVSMIVVPGIGRSVESVRARAEVSGFAAYLRAAREQAIMRGEAQAVRLDPETRSLLITPVGSDAVRSSRTFNFLLRIEADPPDALAVTFEPQGLSSGGTFRILAPGNRRYLVTVDPLTGRVASRVADS
jgi:prepilin-type N-terminal cleavage/methylation domain-containing protein